MPDGSQSWKIIKTSAHSSGRIAQACDRCRSKKIKCDGKLPQCTQCINVGFECKTSDKLSRRAFPRGYTETLEQRVRTLEKELRDANAQVEAKTKALNDATAKAAKENASNPRISLKARLPSESDDEIVVDDVYRLLSRNETFNGSFLGSSSGRPFLELFKRRLQISKNVCVDFDEVLPFYKSSASENSTENDDDHLTDANTSFALPSKVSADKLVQAYFNSWHPLFPVLHRPSFQWDFEAMYTEKASKDPAHFAQLWLVLAIAARDALAKGSEVPEDHAKFFLRARYFLRQLPQKLSVHGLKALILAQLYCFSEENYDLLWTYKVQAVGWALKLGLHRNQKKMKLGPLTTEMRKRVFWSLYVVDAFSSAIVGLPKLLDDRQIDTEFPADTDDDFITEMGFLPTPPGNFSMMSAALALYRVSKILSRLLNDVYSPQRVSMSTIQAIETELNDWRNSLPTYLRVDLPNCIPSSTNYHSHAPMLLLVYHWVRTLVHRPILASTLLRKDETIKATVSLAESSRAVTSILSSLNEKNIPIGVCLSPDFTLWLCCISLLEIALVYDKAGQIDEGGANSIQSALKILRQSQRPSTQTLHEKRLRILDQSFNVIPTRNPHIPPKLDTRSFFTPSVSSISPASSVPTSWPPMSNGITSHPTFDFTFMRTGRLSNASTTESVASSFEPGSAWTPTLTDRFSSSPEQETTKTDLLEAFLSTIDNESYPTSENIFSLQDSPTQPAMMIPMFDWSTANFSDEEETKSGVSPHSYLPMFLSPFAQEDKFDGFGKEFGGFKEGRNGTTGGFADDSGCITTAPNLFSDEATWAV